MSDATEAVGEAAVPGEEKAEAKPAAAEPEAPEPQAPPSTKEGAEEAAKEPEAKEAPAEVAASDEPREAEVAREEPQEAKAPEEPAAEAKVEEAKVETKAEEPGADTKAEEAKPEEAKVEEAKEPEPPPAPAPMIAGIEPATVGVKGGAVVTVLGGAFAEGCSILVDGTPMPGARVHAGRLEVVVSKHAAGAVDVAVKNPDGQTATLAGALRYAEPPVIAALTPARGVTTGGFPITIRGSFFEAGSAVLFGADPVAGVSFVSDTELTVTAPTHHAAEALDVSVVSPSGLSCRAPRAFAYVKAPPVIASVEPSSGPNAGGTKLTIRGTDLDRGCAVYVCGIASKVTWKGREEIEVVTPPVARDGLVDVRLVNEDDQAATLEKAFRYDAPLAPPALVSLTPARGSQVGGTKIALHGEDFAEGVIVRIAGAVAESKFVTRKQLEAVTPAYAGAGEVDVEVVNPDGVAATLEKGFTYEARPAPAITSVSPPSGPSTGGTKVVIEGQNFTKDCQVYVGREYPKDMLIKSATEIHIIVAPRKTPGVVDVEVAAPGVPKAVAKNGYRYDAVPAPIITSVSPNAGSPAGGTEMTIEGKNFRKDSIVLVDGKQPKTVKFVDDKTLEFKAPPGDAGKMVDVIVRNPDGKEALQKRAFLFDPRYR